MSAAHGGRTSIRGWAVENEGEMFEYGPGRLFFLYDKREHAEAEALNRRTDGNSVSVLEVELIVKRDVQ